MVNWSLVIRALAWIWVVHGLIILFKVWAAITGQYTVNWSQELGLYGLIVPPSVIGVFLARRWAAQGRGASSGTVNGAERTGD